MQMAASDAAADVAAAATGVMAGPSRHHGRRRWHSRPGTGVAGGVAGATAFAVPARTQWRSHVWRPCTAGIDATRWWCGAGRKHGHGVRPSHGANTRHDDVRGNTPRTPRLLCTTMRVTPRPSRVCLGPGGVQGS